MSLPPDDFEPFTLPPGAKAAHTTKEAAAVLHFDERTLMKWCRSGKIKAHQGGKGERFWIPAREVERVARRWLMVPPDWTAG